MELNLCKLFGNGTINITQIMSCSTSAHNVVPKILMFLVAISGVLCVAKMKERNVFKLSNIIGSAKASARIPSVSIMTILKSLLLYGTDFRKILNTIFEKYGEIVRFNFFGLYSLVLIANPSMLQKIYTSTEQGHLYKPSVYNKFLYGPFRDGLFSSPPEQWKIHSGVISKAFTYVGLLRQLNIFEEHAKRFILTLQETCKLTQTLNKPHISFEKQLDVLTFEVILHVAAGKEIRTVSQEESTQFKIDYEKFVELISYRVYNPVNMLDFIWKLNPLKQEMDKRMDQLWNYFNKVISSIRTEFDADKNNGLNIDDDMGGKSLVELMTNAGFSNQEMFVELSTFIAAGHDTTNTTIKLLLFLLTTNKEYHDKCRKEVDQMFDQMCALNTIEISLEALNSLTFLDMCIKECLRLYPIVPMFGRELKSPIQLNENIYLSSGTRVIACPLIIHRNPKIYPEPEKFIPERFSPANMRNRGMCEYMPFSAGPRNCIGFKSATIEVKVLVAHILHNFEVSSEMSIDDLNHILRKTIWPFPDLGIKIHPRQ